MQSKYYDEQNVETCFTSILTLKTNVKTGLSTIEVLEKFKPVFLELIESNVPVKMIIEHFHTHEVKIPRNTLSKYISSIRPKKETRIKSKKKLNRKPKNQPLDDVKNNELATKE